MIDAYPRTPAGSTRELVALVGALPPSVQATSFGRFPVAGVASWSDDWLFPRHVPSFHVHEGTDVFAPFGTDVRSPAAGTATTSNGSIGGLSVKVTQADGTYWYLAHLSEVLITDGQAVTPGTLVGRVGDSGNAKGGAAHVHVEVHPGGGDPIDPKGPLDQAYAEALAAAPARVAYYRAGSLAWTSPDRIDRMPRTTLVAAGGPSCSLEEAGSVAEDLSTSTHFDS
jgi:murein DD-endopeptidase MepM/ murein hydrolase activator NlpD